MNWVDWGIALILLVSLIAGMRSGFIREGMRLFGLMAGLVVGIAKASAGAALLQQWISLPLPLGKVLTFIFIFVGALLLCRLVGEVIFRLGRLTPFGWIDRLGGGLLGFCKGALVASVILMMVSLFPLPPWLERGMEKSTLRKPFSGVAVLVYEGVRAILPLARSLEEELKEWRFDRREREGPSEAEVREEAI